MADLATPAAAEMSTVGAGAQAPKEEKAAPPAKPERPDDEQYKTDLGKAEKELRSSEDRMVSCISFGYLQEGTAARM